MVQVEYKKVKNLTLKIKPEGEIIVVAPIGLQRSTIDQFVQSKAPWIEKKLAMIEEKQKLRDNLLQQGSRLFLGESYTLKNEPSLERGYQFDHEAKILYLSRQKQALQKSYQDLAETVFQNVLQSLLPRMNPFYAKRPTLTKRQMSKRWGTCYPQENRIIINTKLIQAPYSLIELVILHELLHFVHPHHQKSFYELFDQLMPDRKQREQKLKNYSFILDIKI